MRTVVCRTKWIVIHPAALTFSDIRMNPLKQAKHFSIPDPLTDIFAWQKLSTHSDAIQHTNKCLCTNSSFRNQVTSATFTGSTKDVIRQSVCIPKPWWSSIPGVQASKWELLSSVHAAAASVWQQRGKGWVTFWKSRGATRACRTLQCLFNHAVLY